MIQASRYLYFLLTVFVFLFLLPNHLWAQKKIKIENADALIGNPKLGKDVRILKGHVILVHNNTTMYCDSAYSYASSDKMQAFGNVRIKDPGGSDITAERLDYDGKTGNANLYNNVKLTDNGIVLTTQAMTYNLSTHTATYHVGGKIEQGTTVLTSLHGYYNERLNYFSFKKNVVLVNPEYTMKCDTLQYDSKTKKTHFLGPTTIVSDNSTIYCERGWYNSETDISKYSLNAKVHSPGQLLTADSLFYNKKTGYGQAYSNVVLIDSVQNIIIKGNYTQYNQKTKQLMVTNKALLIMVSGTDTLFLHGDTLRSNMDSTGENRILKAYYHVRFFQKEMQGKSDSLVYTFSDSTIRLFNQPVLWSDENQMMATTIELFRDGNEIKNMFLQGQAFIVSEEDSLRYNQVKGKNITAFFKKNEIYKVHVKGNAETIYYGRDDVSGGYIGVNKAQSPELIAFMENNKVEKIKMLSTKSGAFSPIKAQTPESLRLDGFIWLNKLRPQSALDIF